MPKLPRLSGAEIVKILISLGFFEARQRGSHMVMKKITIDGSVGCVVPMHKEVATGTLFSILRQAQLTPDEFIEAYQ